MEIKRKSYLDVVRGIAAIGVIFIHVSSNNWYGNIGSVSWSVFTIYTGLCRCAVPIFFMITGALFLDSKKVISTKKLYKKNIMRMIAFLVSWAFVYKIVEVLRLHEWRINVIAIIKDIAVGNVQAHLWYVYATIGIYVCIPVLKVITDNCTEKTLRYAIGVCLVFGCLVEWGNQIPGVNYVTINLQRIMSGIGVGYIGYLLLGHYIDCYDISPKWRRIIYVVGLGSMVWTIVAVMYDCISKNSCQERFWTYNMPNVMLAAVAVFVYFKYGQIPVLAERLLRAIARVSLNIYGCHFVYIILLWTMGITTFSMPAVVSVPMLSGIVLFLSFCTAYVLSFAWGKIRRKEKREC